jgi:gp32 DNA binding protein like
MTPHDKTARIAALKAKMQSDSKAHFEGKKDRDAFWQTPDGESTIRLIHHPGDREPVIPYCNHALQIKGKWFIEDCPMSIDLPCPICESKQERKEYNAANVFVPETGAVLWWKFGVQIAKKIVDLDDAGNDPFDPNAGAHLVVRKPDYHKSAFQPPSALGTDQEIAAILAKCKPLSALLKLKPYTVLKAKYEQMTGDEK